MPLIPRQLELFLVGLFLLRAAPTEAWILLHKGRNGETSHHSRRLYRTTVALSDASLPIMDVSPFVVAGVALGLGVAAQSFINQMLEGDQGLGAFLKDGSGYNKSGFRSGSSSNSEKAADPLPWLQLPRLDFVEVAGQPSRLEEEALMTRLESLRMDMTESLKQGKVVAAAEIREELEALMDEAGIEYSSDR